MQANIHDALRDSDVFASANHESTDASPKYEQAILADATDGQGRFFGDDYDDELKRMARAVLEKEGPIRDDLLTRRIARAHGFARTGGRIKDRVLALLPNVTVTKESVGNFLWPTDSPPPLIPFRRPHPGDERRSLDEIPMPELIGLVRSRPDLAASDDPAIAFAREIGLARLAKLALERLEEAIERANKLN